MHKLSKVLKKKITKELDHLEYLEQRINNQQSLNNNNAPEKKHHSKHPLHLGIKLIFLVYVILVTILDTKMKNVDLMPG
jgi:hypothetical protein